MARARRRMGTAARSPFPAGPRSRPRRAPGGRDVTRPQLGIDTATDRATVALGDAGAAWEHAALEGARRQAAGLLPLVDDVLRRAGVRIPDLSGVVVGDGPGSFTGLRIGWALARGLAHERGIPLF